MKVHRNVAYDISIIEKFRHLYLCDINVNISPRFLKKKKRIKLPTDDEKIQNWNLHSTYRYTISEIESKQQKWYIYLLVSTQYMFQFLGLRGQE